MSKIFLLFLLLILNCSQDNKNIQDDKIELKKNISETITENDSIINSSNFVLDSTIYSSLNDIKDTIVTKNKIGPINFKMPISLITHKFKNCNTIFYDKDEWSDGFYVRDNKGNHVIEFHWKFPDKNKLAYVIINSDKFILKNGLKVGMSITEIENILGKLKIKKDDDGEGNTIEEILIDDDAYKNILIEIKATQDRFIGKYLKEPYGIPETTAVYKQDGKIKEIMIFN